jgi:hypothetical protein
MKMCMEQWWNVTDRGEPKYSERNLSIDLNYIERLSSHRAVNTRLCYKNQSVNAV